jgi:hypothetical protein
MDPMRLHVAFGHCAKPHPKQKIWGLNNIYFTRIHVKQVYSRLSCIEAVWVEHQRCIRGANNSVANRFPELSSQTNSTVLKIQVFQASNRSLEM